MASQFDEMTPYWAESPDGDGITEAELPSYSRKDLTFSDFLLIVRITALLGRIVATQRWLSVPRLVSSFDSKYDPSQASKIDIGRITWLTRGVLRRMFSGRYCMKRSLILFHFLRKMRSDAKIVFGVVKDKDRLEGHAWVTLNGRPFAEEGPVDRYKVTYVYPE